MHYDESTDRFRLRRRRLRSVVEDRLEDEVEAEEAGGGDGEEHQSVEEAESHFHLRG